MKRLINIFFVKRVILVLSGGMWGCISFWWLLISLGLAFPFSHPGTFEYDMEDKYFIPYGYFGLVVYFLLILAAIILNRKKPKRIACFAIPAVCTLIATVILFYIMMDAERISFV